MKSRTILYVPILALLLFATVTPAQAQTPSSQQTLNQYVADLQRSPNDIALRERIIAFVQTMRPAPAIPEEARGHYVMAATFMEKAKDNTGFERAVAEDKAALLAAPWWADAYKKLAIAQKAAEKYDDAVASLNLYLLTQPPDARDALDEIYKLKALKESAADDRKLAEQKAAAEQQRKQREEENSPQKKYDDWLRGLNGAKFSSTSSAGWTFSYVIRGNQVIFTAINPQGQPYSLPGYTGSYNITGRTFSTSFINHTISDDGASIIGVNPSMSTTFVATRQY